jgi:hypothetical protein
MYVKQAFITVTKYLRKLTYKEERFILAHVFRGFSSWSLGPIILDLSLSTVHHGGSAWWRRPAYLLVARKQERKGLGSQ